MDEQTSLPFFTQHARPLCVPPELLAHARTEQIGVLSYDGFGHGKVGVYLDTVRAVMARQAQGFFTISEAAQVLAEATGSPVKTQLAKLHRAIAERALKALDQNDRNQVLDGEMTDYASVLRESDMVSAGFAFPSLAHAAPTEPAPAPETIAPPALDKVTAMHMKKAGMVKAHAHHWPTIEADMNDSARNGLSVAAKAGARGWSEPLALEWARAKGKLTGQTSASKQPAPADPMAAQYWQLSK